MCVCVCVCLRVSVAVCASVCLSVPMCVCVTLVVAFQVLASQLLSLYQQYESLNATSRVPLLHEKLSVLSAGIADALAYPHDPADRWDAAAVAVPRAAATPPHRMKSQERRDSSPVDPGPRLSMPGAERRFFACRIVGSFLRTYTSQLYHLRPATTRSPGVRGARARPVPAAPRAGA